VNPDDSDSIPPRANPLSQVLLIVLGIVGLAFLFIVIQAENAAIGASHSAAEATRTAAEK
jgi:hypothetical protein